MDAGKSKEAHDAISYGAKIPAGAALDLVMRPKPLKAVKQEFADRMADEMRDEIGGYKRE